MKNKAKLLSIVLLLLLSTTAILSVVSRKAYGQSSTGTASSSACSSSNNLGNGYYKSSTGSGTCRVCSSVAGTYVNEVSINGIWYTQYKPQAPTSYSNYSTNTCAATTDQTSCTEVYTVTPPACPNIFVKI